MSDLVCAVDFKKVFLCIVGFCRIDLGFELGLVSVCYFVADHGLISVLC